MSMFGNLSSQGLEESEDRLGGGGYILETDIYSGTIKAAYAGKSAGGAQSVSLIVDVGGKEYKETVYITNKKGENFFLNKNDPSKKVPLPGFTLIDDICLITTDKPLCQQDTDEKVVKIWDKDAGKELPKSVPMLVDLVGKPISLGVVKQIVNKNVLDGSGNYVPTAETREENFTDKVFDTASKFTVLEAKKNADAPVFWDAWLEKNKGQTRDKRSIKDGEAGQAGRPPRAAGTPPQAGGAAPDNTPRKSLFGKK